MAGSVAQFTPAVVQPAVFVQLAVQPAVKSKLIRTHPVFFLRVSQEVCNRNAKAATTLYNAYLRHNSMRYIPVEAAAL